MENPIEDPGMSVNELIKHLELVQPKDRERKVRMCIRVGDNHSFVYDIEYVVCSVARVDVELTTNSPFISQR